NVTIAPANPAEWWGEQWRLENRGRAALVFPNYDLSIEVGVEDSWLQLPRDSCATVAVRGPVPSCGRRPGRGRPAAHGGPEAATHRVVPRQRARGEPKCQPVLARASAFRGAAREELGGGPCAVRASGDRALPVFLARGPLPDRSGWANGGRRVV